MFHMLDNKMCIFTWCLLPSALCVLLAAALLQAAGLVDAVDLTGIERLSMACPALPLCGLAISEAERGLPDVNK